MYVHILEFEKNKENCMRGLMGRKKKEIMM